MSGIVGSKFNHRGSGLIGSLGTDGQHMLSSGAGKKHVFETVTDATYDDEPIKSDITALALREATNEASAAFNLPGSFIETFTDDTNLGTQTDCDRSAGHIETTITDSDFVFALDCSTTSANPPDLATGSTISPDSNGGGLVNETLAGSLDTYVKRWGAATDDWFRFPDSAALNFDGDFALDWQVYFHATSTSDRILSKANSDNSIYQYYARPQCQLYMHGRGSVPAQAVSTGQWYYVCIEAHGSNLNAYLDGTRVEQETATSATNTDLSDPMYVGGAWTGTTNGNIQYPDISIGGMRYKKGSARYDGASSITIPTTPLINKDTTATGTLIQSTNTVGSAKTKVGGTMLYKDNAGTATLGTDLKIYFTCDGGSNWTEAASYNAVTPVYSTGVKQVRLGETTCTSGTDVRYKAVWANQAASSKETQLHGIGINY
jgi:hypothetical protein